MFHHLFYEPVYNLLVVLLNIVPNKDVGIAIILTTIIIKIILLPLNLKAQRGQYLMREIQGQINDIKEKYKGDTKKYSEEIMKLYKEKDISPFTSIFLLLIQIPIFFALFFVFKYDIKLDNNSIYSFVSFPESVKTLAFGLFDLSKNYWWIGVLSGVSMFIFSKRQTTTMNRINEVFNKKKANSEETFADIFAKNMSFQMVYFLPVISGVAASYLPSALGVYWITSNILNILQDIYIKKKIDIEGFIKKHSK